MYIEDMQLARIYPLPNRIDGPYAVGWLQKDKPFPTGETPEPFRERLADLHGEKDSLFIECGVHECEWCDMSAPHVDMGSICIQGPDYRWFIAPMMIEHYVCVHRYKPPDAFIQAVLNMRARMSDWVAISEQDLGFLEHVLGRSPKAIAAIEVRTRFGAPVVIRNQPIHKNGSVITPFPTLYWLVDPDLNTQIANIERKGGIQDIEAALESDTDLMRSHLADNQHYAKWRSDQLAYYDRDLATEQGFLDVLEDSGIGGVANHRAIKCLHAQYAYHLVREGGTTVGRLMEERYQIEPML